MWSGFAIEAVVVRPARPPRPASTVSRSTCRSTVLGGPRTPRTYGSRAPVSSRNRARRGGYAAQNWLLLRSPRPRAGGFVGPPAASTSRRRSSYRRSPKRSLPAMRHGACAGRAGPSADSWWMRMPPLRAAPCQRSPKAASAPSPNGAPKGGACACRWPIRRTGPLSVFCNGHVTKMSVHAKWSSCGKSRRKTPFVGALRACHFALKSDKLRIFSSTISGGVWL